MSDNDDNISKLIIFTLGLATISFFAYLIFKEYRRYQVGSNGGSNGQQMSLVDDNYFQLDRKIHQLEMDRMKGNVIKGNVRTLQPMHTIPREQIQTSGTEGYEQNPDAPSVPRKVVSMNSKIQMPNIHNLSKADQDKVRRLFFNML